MGTNLGIHPKQTLTTKIQSLATEYYKYHPMELLCIALDVYTPK